MLLMLVADIESFGHNMWIRVEDQFNSWAEEDGRSPCEL